MIVAKQHVERSALWDKENGNILTPLEGLREQIEKLLSKKCFGILIGSFPLPTTYIDISLQLLIITYYITRSLILICITFEKENSEKYNIYLIG